MWLFLVDILSKIKHTSYMIKHLGSLKVLEGWSLLAQWHQQKTYIESGCLFATKDADGVVVD